MTELEIEKWLKKISKFDRLSATRLSHHDYKVQHCAILGIKRHLEACRKLDCPPLREAVIEIINDAIRGVPVFTVTGEDKAYVGNSVD